MVITQGERNSSTFDAPGAIENFGKPSGDSFSKLGIERVWGDLKARVKDPFGYVWDLAQKL
jgi:PhnB protein